jgi:hypothetical protein
MNENTPEPIEIHLAQFSPSAAPPRLRSTVLKSVHQQLAASRWERRLTCLAAALVLMGIGLNWSLGFHYGNSASSLPSDLVAKSKSIVDAAVAMAQATDVQTATSFARQWAALSGSPLNSQQSAAMEQEIQERAKHNRFGRKEG